MTTCIASSREFLFIKSLLASALVAGIGVSAQAADSTTVASGSWNNAAIWSAGGVPTGSGTATILNNFTVTQGSGAVTAGRIFVDNGTLNVAGGSATVSVNTINAIHIGRANNSSGLVTVTGGTFSAGNGSTTLAGISLGVGSLSSGTLSVSAGQVNSTLGIIIGSGSNSTGTLLVSGGTVSTGNGTGITGSGTTNVNLFVGGRRSSGSTSGYFQQTGGAVFVNNQSYFNVGSGATVDQVISGTAEIMNGRFDGNVRVGRENTSATSGNGVLRIASTADVNGLGQAWQLASNGEIIFQLGTTTAFSAVDLTGSEVGLNIWEAGGKITIDGSSLILAESYSPITLMTFQTGGVSALSQANAVFGYTGFDPLISHELVWTDTTLQLNLGVVPEPSTVAMLTAAGLGLLVLRRRRRQA